MLQEFANVGILGKVWPSDRVLMGMCVCTWMRSELTQHLDKVTLQASFRENIAVSDISACLSRFHSNSITVRMIRRGAVACSSLLEGMYLALDRGIGTTLTQLDLQYFRGAANNVDRSALTLARVLHRAPALTHFTCTRFQFREEEARAIAEALSGCLALSSLNLENARLQGSVEHLPGALYQCTELREVNLQYSNMGPEGMACLLPALLCWTQLTRLELGSNRIGPDGMRLLAQALGRTAGLTHLDISSSLLGEEGVEVLSALLPQLQALQSLDAGSNGIHGRAVSALGAAISYCTALTHLNLSYNEIGDSVCLMAEQVLGSCTALASINFSGLMIGDAGATGLASALRMGGAVTHLDLCGNDIMDAGVLELAGYRGTANAGAGLAECTSLSCLDLEVNKFGTAGMTALASCLERLSPSLVSLSLGGNDVGIEGASKLAMAIAALPGLRVLDFAEVALGQAGAERLASGLKGCLGLTDLRLAECHMGPGGMAALVRGLWDSHALTSLNVSENGLRSQGAAELSTLLGRCTRLENLEVGENGIGDQGATSIAGAVGQCARLAVLDLRYNQIASAGFACLLQGLRLCPALREIELFENDILGEEGAALQVEELLYACPSLAYVGLSDTKIRHEDIQRLRAKWPGVDMPSPPPE